MSCRKWVLPVVLVAALPCWVSVSAQVDTARRVATRSSIYGGYSWLSNSFNNHSSASSANGMNGWTADVGVPLTRLVNLKVEGLGFYNTNYGDPERAHFFLAGPGLEHRFSGKVLFVQGLVGIGHLNSTAMALGGEPAGKTNSFAADVDAGIDFPIVPTIAWRVEGGLVNSHFTATSNQIHGVPTWFGRVSTGIVFRF
jgi:hypothetical protein